MKILTFIIILSLSLVLKAQELLSTDPISSKRSFLSGVSLGNLQLFYDPQTLSSKELSINHCNPLSVKLANIKTVHNQMINTKEMYNPRFLALKAKITQLEIEVDRADKMLKLAGCEWNRPVGESCLVPMKERNALVKTQSDVVEEHNSLLNLNKHFSAEYLNLLKDVDGLQASIEECSRDRIQHNKLLDAEKWSKPQGLSIRNAGTDSSGRKISNRIVSAIAPGADGRLYRFDFQQGVQQQTSIEVYDDSAGRLSLIQTSKIHIFPRRYKPTYEIDGNTLTITWVTGEQVRFDLNTGTIIDGFLQEQPISPPSKLTPAQVQYVGTKADYVLSMHHQGEGAWIGISRAQVMRKKDNTTCYEVIKGKAIQGLEKKHFYTYEGIFKFVNDSSFYKFIESKCSWR